MRECARICWSNGIRPIEYLDEFWDYIATNSQRPLDPRDFVEPTASSVAARVAKMPTDKQVQDAMYDIQLCSDHYRTLIDNFLSPEDAVDTLLRRGMVPLDLGYHLAIRANLKQWVMDLLPAAHWYYRTAKVRYEIMANPGKVLNAAGSNGD